jgi:formylglycine-generating enzyme required for sulfatase activity
MAVTTRGTRLRAIGRLGLIAALAAACGGSDVYELGGHAAVRDAATQAGFGFLRSERFACGGVEAGVDLFREPRSELEFVAVPADSEGLAAMGEEGAKATGKWLLVGRTEVTQAAWERVMGPRDFLHEGDAIPAMNVKWEEAFAFCEALSMRLPRWNERAYLCAAGVDARFCFGDDEDDLPRYGWVNDPDGMRTKPYRVAQLLPNAFGLYDMHGNMFEWCADVARGHRTKAPPRVVMGGAFKNTANNAECGWAGSHPAQMGNFDSGFRPIRDLPVGD